MPTALVLALTATVAACSAPPEGSLPQAHAPLLGAELCAEGARPSTVGLLGDLNRADGSVRTAVFCTGTLIAPDVVVTAAHCTTETATVNQRVTLRRDLRGLPDADEETRLAALADAVAVRRQVPNPAYDGGSHDHDVGIWLLDAPVLEVEPAIFLEDGDEAQLVASLPAGIAGYGIDDDGAFGALRCGTTTLDRVEALKLFTTGSPQGCSGDSGGGLLVDVDGAHTRRDRLAGVASYVSDNGCVDFTAFTHLGAMRAFVEAELANCDDRAWCEVAGIIPASFYDPPPPADAGDGEDGDGDDDDDGAPGCSSARTAPGSPSPASFAIVALALIALCTNNARRAGRAG